MMPPALFAVCLLGASFAALMFFIKRARYRRWVRASGTVTELIRRESTDPDRPSVTFSPRVSFRTATGQTSEFVSSVSSSPSPRLGDTIAVLYDPSDPSEATIDRFVFR